MPVLLLTEEEVRQVLTMDMALEAVADALKKLALDEAQNVPRARTQTDHVMLHVMSAAAKTMGVMGYKAYTTSRKGTHFHVGLFDGKTGTPMALMQADYLEAQLRFAQKNVDEGMRIARNGLTRSQMLGAKKDEERFQILMKENGDVAPVTST